MGAPFVIGMLAFPNMTLLDFAGPLQVLAKLPEAQVHILWKQAGPVMTDTGMPVVTDTALSDCPPLSLIFVPGGPGQVALMDDDEVLDFLRAQAQGAQWITSVCTGALVLGAAGLLNGFKAATHWTAMEQLPLFGATPLAQRVVFDRNRITGGGVTAGIDFGLSVAALLYGKAYAQRVQLGLEYNPQPPFAGGSPDTSPPEIVAEVRERGKAFASLRRQASERASQRLMPT